MPRDFEGSAGTPARAPITASLLDTMKHLLSAFLLLVLSFATQAADLSITAASVKPSTDAVTRTLTAGEALTAGQLVYRSSSDFKIYKADADHATAANRDVYGVAVTGAASGGLVIVCLEDPNLTIGATVSNGTVYVLSATAGGIAPLADATTGWYPTVVAIGKSASVVAFRAKGIRSATAL